ncbi:hypothetical protein HD554DRAFT_2331689 [Boletus coccyginus]|nr:hypothetical protein HD554DRAFT_2331689 [Boletus coccyginus]
MGPGRAVQRCHDLQGFGVNDQWARARAQAFLGLVQRRGGYLTSGEFNGVYSAAVTRRDSESMISGLGPEPGLFWVSCDGERHCDSQGLGVGDKRRGTGMCARSCNNGVGEVARAALLKPSIPLKLPWACVVQDGQRWVNERARECTQTIVSVYIRVLAHSRDSAVRWVGVLGLRLCDEVARAQRRRLNERPTRTRRLVEICGTCVFAQALVSYNTNRRFNWYTYEKPPSAEKINFRGRETEGLPSNWILTRGTARRHGVIHDWANRSDHNNVRLRAAAD